MPVPATSSAVTRSACSTSLAIVRGAQAEVVGKDGGAVDVVVAMHGINAVEQGDFQAGLQGVILEAVDEAQPVGGGVAGGRIGVAAAQDGAEAIFLHVGRVFQGGGIHLDHLADFFVQGHLGQQAFHLRIVLGEQRGAVAHGGKGDKDSSGQCEFIHFLGRRLKGVSGFGRKYRLGA